MAIEKINITSPVGRFVAGNLYKPNDKDFDGKPLVVKTGPNAGQPRVNYFIALAIPKGPETHWSQTEWGAKIWALGHQAFPQAAQRPDFAWKIEDGDSTIPNKRNRRPCDQEGYARNWILKFSGGFAPKAYFQEGTAWVQNLQIDAIKPGYYIQVGFAVDENGQQANPGVYLNYEAVAFRGFGAEINNGPDVTQMGFGSAPLPAGASAVPLAATLPALPAYAGPQTAPAAPAPPPVPVYPNPAFLQVPAPNPTPAPAAAQYYPPQIIAPVGPGAPPAPPVPSNIRQMTAKAGNLSYQAYIGGGWSDAQLVAEGLMLP